MEVVVKGEKKSLAPGTKVSDQLAEFGLEPGTVIVERNGWIVKRELFEREEIGEGDRVEVIRFAGGG